MAENVSLLSGTRSQFAWREGQIAVRQWIFVAKIIFVVSSVSALVAATTIARADDRDSPPGNAVGPQLFLDDQVIDSLDGLARRVCHPQRLAKPVLDSKTFGVTQPYLSVVRDEPHGLFRIWYNHGPAIWTAESFDGIHWRKPRVAWNIPRGYGASLIDDKDRRPIASRRYKLANWQALPGHGDKAAVESGMYVAFSADGFTWSPFDGNPVLSSWPEGAGKWSRYSVGDIVDVFYDPLARRYGAALKLPALAADGYVPGPRAGKAYRRLVGMSTSNDFIHWKRPWRILVPDSQDDGTLEFYGMGGVHFRGSQYIGLARVLRDDLACDPGGRKDGIGYTVLVASRDGITWHRYREAFIDRNREKGSWDHAMVWTSFVLPVGDEVYFYYGGYARGHKVAPESERQIGLARMTKDRYVALKPTAEAGTLRTKPFVLTSDWIAVNADARRGEIRIRLLDATGKPISKFGQAEAEPIRGDVVAEKLRWPGTLDRWRGKLVRLDFRLRRAELYGFELGPSAR